VSYHLGKTSLRVEILRILLHVLGKAVDSIGKDSDLYLGRAGVSLVDLVLSDDSGLSFLRNHFVFTFHIYFQPYTEGRAGERKSHVGVMTVDGAKAIHEAQL